jgi:deoxycytidylate deaminase
VNCALAIVQAGIDTVVTYRPAEGDDHWLESIDKSRAVFEEAGVEYLELERESR